MITKELLVHNHVLYGQNEVVTELMKHGAISEDFFCEELDDIIEWWLVTPFLAEQLKSEDEIVLENMDCYWWGRTCSGQAIYMDEVISRIAHSFA